ncbi:hypothetical protein SNOG_05328 [Parastagonospora nodorum SN15]|uniref:Uncharacterized protein n=1 Tax=Phaeosphaeria nodorum (strain SN15 / ATCC MYA-4574 / FGSC 10173) TaxID=321614 RepID=Q0USD6_PHANO|nr:hypothetical protein SNOG_05328 [Parastagonospora nodorum SN15]EAT87719.1 hypothetical protein SNOG_05328 [Parastagonospora nodorum SN15]
MAARQKQLARTSLDSLYATRHARRDLRTRVEDHRACRSAASSSPQPSPILSYPDSIFVAPISRNQCMVTGR